MSPRQKDTLDQVRLAADSARTEIQERDLWIRVAHKEGHSLRVIAEAAGLSHAGIKKIVERHD